MRITRRRRPLDFGASNDDGLAPPAPVAAAPEDRAEGPDIAVNPAADAPPEDFPQSRATAHPGIPAAPTITPRRAPPSAWPIYLTAFAVATLWALGPIAFAFGYRSATAPLQNDRFALIVFALLAIGPAALVFAVAYFIRQGQKLALEARRAREVESELMSPALRAAAQAGEVTAAVRLEIARAAEAADAARENLIAMLQALAQETEVLTQATENSLAATRSLAGQIGDERGQMQALAASIDAQVQRAAGALDEQVRRVSNAAQTADGRLREAVTALAARAADLTAAAAEAGNAARSAGDDLARHTVRLEAAGEGVVEQVRGIEGGLSHQRVALLDLAEALRSDHATFSAEAEAHAVRLDAFIGETRRAAGEMNEGAVQAGEALRGVVGEARSRFAELAQAVADQRQALGENAAQALATVGRSAAEERARLVSENQAAIQALDRAAEETRQAAARHAAAARDQVDQLSEAAFAAGQKANQVFEARLEEARALVEQSAKMVGDAGAVAARKLDEGAVAARATLDELTTMLETLEARARELPGDAEAQVAAVQASVAQGLDALMTHARRTAEEAQAIDAAFQERVRRNFDMLSEAVRLMGTVAAAPPAVLTPQPAREAAAPAFTPAYAPPTVRAMAPEPVLPPRTEVAAGAEGGSAAGALAERLGLRPRLKLTPTVTDEEFSAIFESAGAPKAGPSPDEDAGVDEEEPSESWTWKDLLASLGGGEGATEPEEALLAAELGKMGVEPEKLLPKARIDQIAAAIQTGDLDGARHVVKRLAGAASRRIVRRLFTDEELKAKASDFVHRYQGVVDDAAVRDPEGFLMANLLGSEAGRVFLLLDQALGDAA